MIVSVRAPPMRTASRSDMASSPTPGQLGVGEQRLGRDRRVRRPDVLFEHRRRQRGDVGGARLGLVGLAHRGLLQPLRGR